MRSGFVDMFTSRRDCFDDCRYWKKIEDDNMNYIDYEYEEPSGYFAAKQITSIQNMPQVVAGLFMFDSNSVTIQSYEDLSELSRDDIIEFRGNIYRLQDIQSTPIRKNNQFYDEVCMVYYMRLKR